MSADNWAFCPKCQSQSSEEDGKEPALREDYEQGMSQTGEYFLVYHCHCENCGFDWTFKHKEQVVPKKSLRDGV